MSAASISQFDCWLVNQQRQIYDSIFRLFDLSKLFYNFEVNISRCQKATTLILITLYNPSFHLWKTSNKSLGITVFLSWLPFKSATVTSFSQLHLSRTSCSRRSLDKINLHFLALYTRWLIKKGEKCEKLSRKTFEKNFRKKLSRYM